MGYIRKLGASTMPLPYDKDTYPNLPIPLLSRCGVKGLGFDLDIDLSKATDAATGQGEMWDMFQDIGKDAVLESTSLDEEMQTVLTDPLAAKQEEVARNFFGNDETGAKKENAAWDKGKEAQKNAQASNILAQIGKAINLPALPGALIGLAREAAKGGRDAAIQAEIRKLEEEKQKILAAAQNANAQMRQRYAAEIAKARQAQKILQDRKVATINENAKTKQLVTTIAIAAASAVVVGGVIYFAMRGR